MVKVKNGYFRYNFLLAIIIFTLLFGTLCSAVQWEGIIIKNEVAVSGESRMADITEIGIHGRGSRGGGGYLYPGYVYYDENGLRYDGDLYFIQFDTYYEAEAFIKEGHQVEIKIDGKGNSVLATYKQQSTVPIAIITILCPIFAIGFIALTIVINVKKIKKKKASEETN